MARKMEDILDELESEGLDALAGELRAAWDASPLRRSNEEFKAKAEAALAEAKRYQQVVASQRFRDFGIKVKPDALVTPDDLDWTDESKVREWAINSGLIDPPEPEPEPTEEVDAHGRMSAASSGAAVSRGGVITPDDAAEWAPEKWKRFEKQHPVEADELSRGEVVKGITY